MECEPLEYVPDDHGIWYSHLPVVLKEPEATLMLAYVDDDDMEGREMYELRDHPVPIYVGPLPCPHADTGLAVQYTDAWLVATAASCGDLDRLIDMYADMYVQYQETCVCTGSAGCLLAEIMDDPIVTVENDVYVGRVSLNLEYFLGEIGMLSFRGSQPILHLRSLCLGDAILDDPEHASCRIVFRRMNRVVAITKGVSHTFVKTLLHSFGSDSLPVKLWIDEDRDPGYLVARTNVPKLVLAFSDGTEATYMPARYLRARYVVYTRAEADNAARTRPAATATHAPSLTVTSDGLVWSLYDTTRAATVLREETDVNDSSWFYGIPCSFPIVFE